MIDERTRSAPALSMKLDEIYQHAKQAKAFTRNTSKSIIELLNSSTNGILDNRCIVTSLYGIQTSTAMSQSHAIFRDMNLVLYKFELKYILV